VLVKAPLDFTIAARSTDPEARQKHAESDGHRHQRNDADAVD